MSTRSTRSTRKRKSATGKTSADSSSEATALPSRSKSKTRSGHSSDKKTEPAVKPRRSPRRPAPRKAVAPESRTPRSSKASSSTNNRKRKSPPQEKTTTARKRQSGRAPASGVKRLNAGSSKKEDTTGSVSRRTRLADPRRMSFFDSPKGDSSSGSSRSRSKSRRKSTRRDAQVVAVDGFMFKRKGKPAPAAPEGKEAAVEKPRRHTRAAAQGKEVKRRPAKRAKSSVNPPPYPLDDEDEPALEPDSESASVAPEVAIQRFMEQVVQHEVNKVAGVFTGPHSYVEKAVSEVGSRFVADLKNKYTVSSIKALRNADVSGFKNNDNKKLHADEAVWTEVLQSVQLELEQWEEQQRLFTKLVVHQPAAPAVVDTTDPSTFPEFISDADRKFLEQTCTGLLSRKLPGVLQQISIMTDTLLSSFRELAARIRSMHEQHQALAEEAYNRAPGSQAAVDPRQLITGLGGAQ